VDIFAEMEAASRYTSEAPNQRSHVNINDFELKVKDGVSKGSEVGSIAPESWSKKEAHASLRDDSRQKVPYTKVIET